MIGEDYAGGESDTLDRHFNSFLVEPVGSEQLAHLMDDQGSYRLGWDRDP
jgi:hypothetical protein